MDVRREEICRYFDGKYTANGVQCLPFVYGTRENLERWAPHTGSEFEQRLSNITDDERLALAALAMLDLYTDVKGLGRRLHTSKHELYVLYVQPKYSEGERE